MTLQEKTLHILAPKDDDERDDAISRLTDVQKDILIFSFAKKLSKAGRVNS